MKRIALIAVLAFAGVALFTPWLFGEAQTARLQAWHQRMQASHPIVFRGKTAACKAWSRM